MLNPKYNLKLPNLLPQDQKDNLELVFYPKAGHLLEPPYAPLCRSVDAGKLTRCAGTIPEKHLGKCAGTIPEKHLCKGPSQGRIPDSIYIYTGEKPLWFH